jgi:hypothetical protein
MKKNVDRYFLSEQFLNVDYWKVKWECRMFWFWKYCKFDLDLEEYKLTKEPKFPVLENEV